MSEYDLVIRGGTVVTADDSFKCDLAVRSGRIVALGDTLRGNHEIDATGLLVMPGGIDTHCHIEQFEPDGTIHEETFVTASKSALSGGTTTVICFSAQFKGHSIYDTLEPYRVRARKSIVDYSFHQIITDPTERVIKNELPEIIASGIRSLKVFLAYDPLRLSDYEYLRVLAAARENNALVTVHAENYDAIKYFVDDFSAKDMIAPHYHAVSRPPIVEREATYRAIALAELMNQPIQIFHVSCPEVAEEIARAKLRGVKVWGETCTQYLVLTADNLKRPGFEGCKYICSPALRDDEAQNGLWNMIRRGVLDVISSDHCGFSFGGSDGKARSGQNAPFQYIPNGIPGLAARLPIIFSEGVSKGRISPSEFVSLTSTRPARLMGLSPRKGSLNIGADADITLWDPTKRTTLTNSMMNHAIDYTPYENFETTGWPVKTLLRGKVLMEDGLVQEEVGFGEFIARTPYDYIRT